MLRAIRSDEFTTGIELGVPRGVRPRLVLEAGAGSRIRLTSGGEPVMWARVAERYDGVWLLLRSHQSLGVVPPIRAELARKIHSPVGWVRWFAERLLESEVSPLRPGAWTLTAMRPGEHRGVFRPHDTGGGPGPAFHPHQAFDEFPIRYIDWHAMGSADIVALRDASPADDGRVQAWRKSSRDGTLPPILLWWVGGLDAHVILDGHDRLQAALREDIAPSFITLWEPAEGEHRSDEERAAIIAGYENAFSNAKAPSLESRRVLARSLLRAYAGERSAWTRATGRDFVDEWDAQVRAEFGEAELPYDVAR